MSATTGRPPLRHYATYFDRHYLVKGLALYRSLERHSGPFILWTVCFDDETHAILRSLELPHARLIRQAELDAWDRELAATATDGRSRVEYYFTTTPCLLRLVLERAPDSGLVTYLEADLFFYSSPEALFDELGERSVMVVAHRFHADYAWLTSVAGIYNVGALVFRDDDTGRACLDRWRAQCLTWCHRRAEEGKYADQRYLDEWPSRYAGRVAVARRPGIGVAHWNLRNYAVAAPAPHARPAVDGDPVVFYHWSGLAMLSGHLFVDVWRHFPLDRDQFAAVYAPYLRALRQAADEVRAVAPRFSARLGGATLKSLISGIGRGRLILAAERWTLYR